MKIIPNQFPKIILTYAEGGIESIVPKSVSPTTFLTILGYGKEGHPDVTHQKLNYLEQSEFVLNRMDLVSAESV